MIYLSVTLATKMLRLRQMSFAYCLGHWYPEKEKEICITNGPYVGLLSKLNCMHLLSSIITLWGHQSCVTLATILNWRNYHDYGILKPVLHTWCLRISFQNIMTNELPYK